MSKDAPVSDSFQVFVTGAADFSGPWMEMVQKLDSANALEPKTKVLAYMAVLAAAGLTSGIPFHAAHARSLGATKEEIIGAILVGLPAVGHVVIQSLPAALSAFEQDSGTTGSKAES